MKKNAKNFNLKRLTFTIFTCLIVILIILQAPKNIDAREILEFNRDPQNYNVKLTIIDSDEKEIAEFLVAVAKTEESRIFGLMNLDKLPKNFGMVFPSKRNEVATMWMKNTRIPLDMIFINENNIIANIKTNTTPYSLDLISSEVKVKKVLEINAGLVEKLGIKVGQKVK
jgi:uncharacterized protein